MPMGPRKKRTQLDRIESMLNELVREHRLTMVDRENVTFALIMQESFMDPEQRERATSDHEAKVRSILAGTEE